MKTQLKTRNRITIPESITNQLGLAEGDDLLIEVRDGNVVLIPAESVPRDEAYLFTDSWRQAIEESKADVAEGRVKTAPNAREMFRQIRGK